MTTFENPQVFTTGTVGPPGDRTFYLQAVHDGETASVKVEKQQVVALIEYLDGLLDDLPTPDPVIAAPDLRDPGEPDWIVGTIGVAYDNEADRVIIVADELVAEEIEDGRQLQVVVTREQIKALIERAETVVSGGRPPCRLCGAPLDPDGHACPRAN